MYSGINVHGFSTTVTTGGNFRMVGGISCLHSIGCHKNAASCLDCSLTIIIAPNFIKKGSVVPEIHHFYDYGASLLDTDSVLGVGSDPGPGGGLLQDWVQERSGTSRRSDGSRRLLNRF